uniref:Protein amnionless n=1 Tax=Panagrolaimus superbus TaxID=310955 RepID=A0A914YTV4_9BILA
MRNSEFILTMEGQFIFQIGPKLKTKLVIDQIEFQMPNTDIIQVVDGPVGGPKGMINSNTQEPQFSEICRFVECPDWKPYCTNPVKPFGHCCDICGAIATFFHPSMSLIDGETIISNIAQEERLPKSVGLDISRADKTAVIPKYQISVITENFEDFDENSFYSAANALYDEFVIMAEIHDESGERNAASKFTGFEINYSLETGKIRLRPLLETLLFIGLLGAVISVYLRHLYRTSPRFRLWLSSQDVTNRMTVAWRNAKEYTEEKVEVILRPTEPQTHAFAHYRNQPDDSDPFEAASYQSSSANEYFSEFRNPTFVEYSPEELETKPELLKEEIKEENLFELNF